MLDVLRRGASTWVSKLLLAFLIVSFGVWGIADVFRGFGSNTVATIGSTHVTATEFDAIYRRELDNWARRVGKPLSREEAMRAGLPTQILGRLVNDGLLSESARRLGIGVSDEELVRQIRLDKNFQNSSGQFDRLRFSTLLQQNGWTEDQYVATARQASLRQQVVDAVGGTMPAPMVLLEANNRYKNEERTVAYVELKPDMLGAIADPADDVLAKFYEERKGAFRAPEYRKIVTLSLVPEALAKPGDVTDDDAKAAYERADSRFGAPERRRVDQMPFDKPEDAAAALARIRAGESFDKIAEERALKVADLDLGLLAKPGFLDAAVGTAAFGLAKPGDVSDVIKGRFKPVLIRLTEVQPAGRKPFDEVKAELKTEIANQRAADEIFDRYKEIEDARAGGTKLEEIAGRFGLKADVVDAVDRTGRAPDGATPNLPEQTQLLKAAFESDVGVENDPIRVGNRGFVWFDVAGITPARDRPLDEVKPQVVAQWKTEQVRTGLGAKAVELVARLQKGEKIEDVAASAGLEVKTSPSFSRGGTAEGLSAAAVSVAFQGPEGYVGTALGDNDSRIVLVVKDVAEPAFFGESDALKGQSREIATDIQNTILDEYVRRLRTDIAPTVNQQLVLQLTGNSSTQQQQ